MHDSIMFEVARQRIADQQRAAVKNGEAKALRSLGRGALGRGRRARRGADESIATPLIPDYAHELLAAAARDSVPAQRPEAGRSEAARLTVGRGRHARAGR